MKFCVRCKSKKKVAVNEVVEDKVFIPETQSCAVSVYFATKPIFLLSRILGIAPFVLRSDPQRLEFSKNVALYGIFLAVVMTIFLIKESHYVVIDVVPPLFRFVMLLQIITLVVPSTYHRLMALANAKTVIHVLSQLDDIDHRLKLEEHCHVKGFRHSIILTTVTTVAIVTFGSVRIYLASLTEFSSFCFSLMASMSALFAVLTFYISEYQFVGLVLLIRQRFVALNELVMDVGSIRKLHDELCVLCETVNCCFSSQMLVNVIFNFLSLIYSCYFCCLSILGQDRGNYSSIDWDALTLYGLVLIVSSLMIKLIACHFTAAEGNRTAVLLHREYDRLTDMETKMEVQMLSLQLLHNKIRFSACGVFPLDLSLLYSIVGAVTTYLVILIQFQLSTPGDNTALEKRYNVTPSSL